MEISKEDQKILTEAHKQFRILYDANEHLRKSFIKSMKFSFNIAEGPWDSADIAERDKKKRAHITAHKLGKFVTQVVNNERGTPNRDQVIPVDDSGDKEIAKIYNYLINDIEYHSNYDEVFMLAGEHAVGGGFGFWRILTEFEPDGVDQIIRIKPIKNPLNVFLDERGRRAFIREGMSIDEFDETWPDFKEKPDDFEDFGDQTLWYEDEKVFIAEYFRRVPVKKTIGEIVTGDGKKIIIEIKEDTIEKSLRTREVNDFKIEWYKLCGHAILERGEWIGNEIPIIEVVGQEIQLEGKTYKKSLGKDVEDINRALNYWFTSLTEKVALSPKAPYLVTPQQIRGFEDEWKNANVDLQPYLRYNSLGTSGAPQRAPSPEVGTGELTMLNICDTYIKDILGMYESSMGAPSNERSGRAIQARASQSNLTNFHFPDNLRRARLKTKKMLINIIPKVYSNERTVRVIGYKTPIKLNEERKDLELGTTKILNDLSVGKYDIRASNPMNPTIRQRAEESLRDYMQYVPTHADVILPVAVSFSDIPGSDKLMEALSARTKEVQQMKAQELQQKSGGMPI